MRFVPFLFLLFLYLRKCNGTPPNEVAKKTHARGSSFSDKEDKLIIEELSRLSVDNQLKMYSNNMWEHIANIHREKWQQQTPGFLQERTPQSLLAHFKLMARFNHQKLNSKVPEHLLKYVRQDLNKPSRGKNAPYTPEENTYIIEQLCRPSCTAPYALSLLEVISKKITEKIQDLTPGFENVRTAKSLRSHVQKLKRDGKLPDELLKKIRENNEGASSSNPTPSNQQTDLEMINTEDDEAENDLS